MSQPNPQTNNLNDNETFTPLSNSIIIQLRLVTLREAKLRVMDKLANMLDGVRIQEHTTDNLRGYLRAIDEMQHYLRGEWR